MHANIIGRAKNLFELIAGLSRRADRENNGRQADALEAIKHHATLGYEMLQDLPLRAEGCSCQMCVSTAELERQYS